MDAVEYDPETGLLAVSFGATVHLLDEQDLAAMMAEVERLWAVGEPATPNAVWRAIGQPPSGEGR
jgi:hypothetical protein